MVKLQRAHGGRALPCSHFRVNLVVSLAAVLAAALLTAPAQAATTTAFTPVADAYRATTTGNDTCGQRLGSSAPSKFSHIIWVIMENQGYSQIVGNSGAPYLNSLASKCGLATNYYAVAHPSLPNYIAMTSGSTQGVSDDAGPSSHPLSAASIFSQLGSASGSIQESMPSNCYLDDWGGDYSVHHNPQAYYTNVRADCASTNVPLGSTLDLSRKFTLVTPNRCNDMHSCPVSTGDAWLGNFIPRLIASREYQAGTTAIFITWDEDDHDSSGNHIATFVLSPYTQPGASSSTRFDHYSLLATTLDLLGETRLAGVSGAASMAAPFGLAPTRAPLSPGSAHSPVSLYARSRLGLRTLLRRGISVRVEIMQPGTVSVALRTGHMPARRTGRSAAEPRPLTLARATRSLPGPGTYRIRVRAGRRARRALLRGDASPLTAVLSAQLTTPDGKVAAAASRRLRLLRR